MVRPPLPENGKYYLGAGLVYLEGHDDQGVYLRTVDRLPDGVTAAGTVRDCGTFFEIKEYPRPETHNELPRR